MIKTIEELNQIHSLYADIQGKLSREIKHGNLHPIIRGLYETDASTPGYFLAGFIYGPSYLSFEFALAYHGMIPERVITFTSATFNKRKTKTYQTPFGNFVYRDVPKAAFPYGIELIDMNGYMIHMASKEKALCDMLSQVKPQTSLANLKVLLFDDLRIDESEFNQLNIRKFRQLIPFYQKKNITLLGQLLKGVTFHAHPRTHAKKVQGHINTR